MSDKPHIDMAAEANAYWAALGQFVYEFADLERLFFITLIRELGIDMQDAQAIFSNYKMDQLTNAITSIRRSRGAKDSPSLHHALEGIRVLKERRDSILHRGTNFQSDGNHIVTKDL